MKNLLNIFLLLLKVLFDGVKSDLSGDNILNSHSKTILMEPIIYKELSI
jgi:hypothetical protein